MAESLRQGPGWEWRKTVEIESTNGFRAVQRFWRPCGAPAPIAFRNHCSGGRIGPWSRPPTSRTC